ncbi:RNA pyrophosphohydrolase [Thalassobaculum salexigens]|uniref:RNA pyrophosphohydrolase n=1 Tax=Thalassobaculum salexigens TaxID=455360 RepID=UPI00248EDA46|nr:RNA pyrophosphohydrolase [Thalassobaculum salexigens]
MTDRSALPLRPCVGIVLFNDTGQVFVGKRIGIADAWQMPQGGIDKGETPRQAGLRELEEEIGTSSVEVVAETAGWVTYEFPADLPGKIRESWRGQTQKWLACRFTGTATDIDLQTEHPEFDDWKWVDLGVVVELIVPFKRATYEAVVAELGPAIAAATATPDR